MASQSNLPWRLHPAIAIFPDWRIDIIQKRKFLKFTTFLICIGMLLLIKRRADDGLVEAGSVNSPLRWHGCTCLAARYMYERMCIQEWPKFVNSRARCSISSCSTATTCKQVIGTPHQIKSIVRWIPSIYPCTYLGTYLKTVGFNPYLLLTSRWRKSLSRSCIVQTWQAELYPL